MKTIRPEELYSHLSQFLKGKGIELTDGPYVERIRKGCSLLTDVVNGTQRGLTQARTRVDRKLDEFRQVIHEKTAPKPPPPPRPPRRRPSARKPAKSSGKAKKRTV
ncbi:MAG TPA: hypothetical protein PKM73_02045 [Verrucomicrobiota bacterium]|nr:hypothetical protein [Verrucomicrobiota bacterium]HNU50333.1 hypothetical protein [Verrucomicrobiota bacterium]